MIEEASSQQFVSYILISEMGMKWEGNEPAMCTWQDGQGCEGLKWGKY